jgi:hypothetical protein
MRGTAAGGNQEEIGFPKKEIGFPKRKSSISTGNPISLEIQFSPFLSARRARYSG